MRPLHSGGTAGTAFHLKIVSVEYQDYLKPRWGDYLLDHIRPMAVEEWLKTLPMAPKSKTHIRSVMHVMFECATRWKLFTEKRNPIALVRVKGGSKRRQRPMILAVDQFETVVELLKEPYRTMVYIAQCLGLRVSEIAALRWDDSDFNKNQLLVQRSRNLAFDLFARTVAVHRASYS